jgi:uncharacterized membrane protein
MGGLFGVKSLSINPIGGNPVWGILILAAAVLFSVWAYRTTLPAVTSRWRGLLLALRCATFATLALILFQPVAAVVAPHSGRPSVPVLLDVSASMETRLGEAGADTTRTRLQAGARAVEVVRSALQDRYRVPVYPFALRVQGSGSEGPLAGRDNSLPDTSGSKYATAIGDALEEIVLRREAGSVVGVVLVSDGATNRGEDPLRSLRSVAVPVYTVSVGETHGIPDSQVFEVRANPTAYVDSEVQVRVVVKSQGFEGREAELELREGDKPLAAKKIVLAGAGFEQEVDLAFVPHEPGERFYTVSLQEMEGERTDRNNTRSLAINVVQEKQEALYVEGRPSWEFTFLKRTLDTAGNLQVRYLVAFDGRRLEPLDPATRPFPETADGLSGYSLVIIGDCDPSLLSDAQWSALVGYVRRGGGAILMAGRSQAGLNRFASTPAAELVPLGLAPGIVSRRSGSFPVSLTAAGREHPVTKVDVDVAVCDSLWAELPPLLDVYLIGGPRPRGQVLVSAAAGGRSAPVIAVMNLDRGKVMAVNSSSLWRWGFLSEGLLGSRTLYDRLWANAVRWLTRGEEEGVSVFSEEGVYQSGEVVRLGASVTGEGYRPITGASVSVGVEDASGRGISRASTLVDSDVPGHYEGKLDALAPGDYELHGRASVGGRELGEASARFRVDSAGLEYIDLNARADVMKAIAAESGGRAYTVDDLDDLRDDIGRAKLEFTRTVEVDVWNNPAVFIALLGLLGAEWTLRRRLGMA